MTTAHGWKREEEGGQGLEKHNLLDAATVNLPARHSSVPPSHLLKMSGKQKIMFQPIVRHFILFSHTPVVMLPLPCMPIC